MNMLRSFLLLSATFVVFASASVRAQDDEIPKGFEKIQGKWKMVGLVVDNKVVNPPPRYVKLTVKGTKFIFDNGKPTIGVYKIDTSGKVATIDIEFTDGERKGTKLLGVFDTKKDMFRLCFTPVRNPRPTAVAAKPGNTLEVWQKTK